MVFITTISSKGQLVIPSTVREKMGLNSAGQKVILSFDEGTKSVRFSAPRDMDEISNNLAAKAKKNKIKPLINPSSFYANREYGEK
jgi:AbrB family looped-hinge helix DNA binding protein